MQSVLKKIFGSIGIYLTKNKNSEIYLDLHYNLIEIYQEELWKNVSIATKKI